MVEFIERKSSPEEPVSRESIADILALTPAQQGMLFHYLESPGSTLYLEVLCLDLGGDIENRLIEEAWNIVTGNNEMLRTVFRWEKQTHPVQMILKDHSVNIDFYDFSSQSQQSPPQQSETLQEFFINRVKTPLNLQNVPFHVILCRTAEKKCRMWLKSHHILFDGWSNGIILQEFFNAYNLLRKNGGIARVKKTGFKEFVKWSKQQDSPEHQQFWHHYFKGCQASGQLPVKRPNAKVKALADDPGCLKIKMPGDVKARLDQFTKTHQVTFAALIYSTWSMLLQKYGDSDDIVFGTTVSGRSAPVRGIEEMVGLFINTLPLRVTASGEIPVSQLLKQVNGMLQQREPFNGTPLVKIKEFAGLTGDKTIFDSILVIENYPLDSGSMKKNGALEVMEFSMTESTNFDLTVGITVQDKLEIQFLYRRDRFETETIEALSGHFLNVLQQIPQQADHTLSEIQLLSTQEREKLLMEFNREPLPLPAEMVLPVHRLVGQQAQRTPHSIAIGGEHSLSFRQLYQQASERSKQLKGAGVRPGMIVALLLPPGNEMIISILAVLKAAAAYLPIDPAAPQKRVDYILKDSHAHFIIRANTKLAPGGNGLINSQAVETGTSELCYIIYTSGTTGQPKGVMIDHGMLVNQLYSLVQRFEFQPWFHYVLLAAYTFDVSVMHIVLPLISGGTLHIPSDAVKAEPRPLWRFLQRMGIDILNVVPAFMNALLSAKPQKIKQFNYLFLGGDTFPPQLFEHLKKAEIARRIINIYGPTESTINALCYEFPAEIPPDGIPIGKPLNNYMVHVLDRHLNLQPIGVPGELHISGPSIARGYLNRPQLTAQRFVSLSWWSCGSYMAYKTGDIACRLPDGNIQFLGRLDLQVKVRGFRIELQEIQQVLLQHPSVQDAIVVAMDDAGGDKQLCAYMVPHSETIHQQEISDYLSASLPAYMVPGLLLTLEQIPLTSSGKPDRQALRHLSASANHSAVQGYAAPVNATQRQLTEIWSKLLTMPAEAIGIRDNFFHMGGHSLNAISLASLIHKTFHIPIRVTKIFETPFIETLSFYIDDAASSTPSSVIAGPDQGDYYPLSHAQKRLYLLQQMDPGSTAYNMYALMDLQGKVDKKRLEFSYKQLIYRHESLRTVYIIRDGEPVQRILPAGQVDFYFQPLTDLADFVQAFDLTCAPLLRVGYGESASEKDVMMVDLHHIAADGPSVDILMRQLLELYRGGDPQFPTVRYRDYAAWQQGGYYNKILQQQESYWLNVFAHPVPDLTLALDYARPQQQSFSGKVFPFAISASQSQALNELAVHHDVTLFTLLLTLFKVLLAKLSGQRDVIVGIGADSRTHEELKDVVGMFVNTLALRSFPGHDRPFFKLLQEVKETVIQALENRDYPFDELIEKVNAQRTANRNPLFDVMFQMDTVAETPWIAGDLEIRRRPHQQETSKLDLTLWAYNYDSYISFGLEYCTALFAEQTIEGFSFYFKEILSMVLDQPTGDLTVSQLISPATTRKQHMVSRWNREIQVQVDSFDKETIQQLLNRAFGQLAGNVAIENGDDEHISFAQLHQETDTIAANIFSQCDCRFVGVMLTDSIDVIRCMLALLLAGTGFVPLDPNLPHARLKTMAASAGLTDIIIAGNVPVGWPDTVRFIALEDLQTEKAKSLTHVEYSADDRIYLYFTSGSSGEPKGVIGRNKSLVQFIDWEINRLKLSTGTRFSQLVTPGFDAFLRDVLVPLCSGGTICIPPDKDIAASSEPLVQWLDRRSIQVIHCVPTQFRLFNRSDLTSRHFSSLKFILLSGEPITAPDLSPWFACFSDRVTLMNLWGPTETTMVKSCHVITGADLHRERIPVGKPMPGTQVIVLDEHMEICDQLVTGELYIRTPYRTYGYHDAPLLNARQFMPWRIPEMPALTLDNRADLLYRTGDRGRINSDGTIDVMGRIDRQIKVRGVRIEPLEVESVMMRYPLVKEAAVFKVTNPEAAGDETLCACYSTGQNQSIPASLTEQLMGFLSLYLPAYMVPSRLAWLEKMPLLPNGKIDYPALPSLLEEVRQPESSYTAPQNEIQKQLQEIWCSVLKLPEEEVSVKRGFFEMGGNSLHVMTLISRIYNYCEVRFSLAEIFSRLTIEKQAQMIAELQQEETITIEPAPEQEYYPLSPAQKRLYFLQQLEPESVAYNMPSVFQLKGKVDVDKTDSIYYQLIERHESLRTSFILKDEEPVQRIIGRDTMPEPLPPKTHLDTVQPFDLSRAPLFRMALEEVGRENYLLNVDMHHIISDGVSQSLLIKDFIALYQGEQLQPLSLTYKDYAYWLKGVPESQRFKEQERYWLNRFQGQLPVLDLPLDFIRPPLHSFEGKTIHFKFGSEHSRALMAYAQQEGVTLYMLLISIYAIFLWKITAGPLVDQSGVEDIVIGTTVAGRGEPGLQEIIGMFVHTLPLRFSPALTLPFDQFLQEVRQETLNGLRNQDYPFEELVEKRVTDRRTNRNPLFDVMFVLQNMEMPSLELTDLQIKSLQPSQSVSHFDFSLIAVERSGVEHSGVEHSGVDREGVLEFSFEYCTKLFLPATARRFCRYFTRLSQSVLENPGNRISRLEILPQVEKEKLLSRFNSVDQDYSLEKTIDLQFADQARRFPFHIAIRCGEKQLNYRQLEQGVDELAYYISSRGIGVGDIVAMMVERSIEMITGILAILKTGAAYLPVDPLNPGQRIVTILKDSRPALFLTESRLLNPGERDERDSLTYSQIWDALSGMNHMENRVPVTVTAKRPAIVDFDDLPIPDRSLVNYDDYSPYIGQAMVSDAIALQATRGCPYNCLYCHKIWPKKHTIRSADNIFQEVELYYTMGVRRFVFIDDIFNFDRKNSRDFFQAVIESGMEVQLYFPNGMRGDLLTKEYIDLMVQAGTVNVALALETASPRIQRLIKKFLNLEKLRENIEYICTEYPHVIVELFTMHGFPTETEQEARMTLDFIMGLKWLHFPYVHVLKIFPDTDMEALALESGVRRDDILSSMDLAYHELPDTLPFAKSFTKGYQAEFLNNYFLDPERLYYVLPLQMKVLTESELIQKYNSYLPVDIHTLEDLYQALGLSKSFSGVQGAVFQKSPLAVGDGLNKRIANHFNNKNEGELNVLLIDLSQYFSGESRMLYDVVEPPLGLMYLMTYLQRALAGRVRGKIIKSRIDFDDNESLREILEEFKPDVIGIRTLSLFKDFFHRTAAMIRQWGITTPIVAGGPYATSSYEILLQDNNIDLVVLGEGEVTFSHLIERMLANGGRLPGKEQLSEIAGIAFAEPVKKQQYSEIMMLDQFSPSVGHTLPPVNISAADAAYIIYTSGSTGRPKGVVVEHGNVMQLLMDPMKRFDFDERDVWSMFHSYNFDFSVWEMYGALLYGGKLVMVPRITAIDPKRFLDLIKSQKITVLNQTPSAFYHLSEAIESSEIDEFPLRLVIFGGETLKPGKLNSFHNRFPHIKLINMYGITETTVHVTYKEISSSEIETESSNIGMPLPCVTAYVLDCTHQLGSTGIPGELFVGGQGVARGYLNAPELTADRFMANPFKENERFYRSGDLVRLLKNGEMQYLSRIDHQVQIRGFRVEMGEIENCLMHLQQIKEAVVLDQEDLQGDTALYAFVVPAEPGGSLDFDEVKRLLARELTGYMIPAHFYQWDAIPLTANGKINRSALLESTLDKNTSVPLVQATDDIQLQLQELWAALLDIPFKEVTPGRDFFQLGGHSLKAASLIARVHKVFDVTVSLVDFFQEPTLPALAALIKKGRQQDYRIHFDVIPVADDQDYYPLTSTQLRLYYLQQQEPSSTSYNVPIAVTLEGETDIDKFEAVLQHMIRRHESFRTMFEIRDGKPVQVILPWVDFAMQKLGAGHDPDALIHDSIQPFDLTRPPLLRVAIAPLLVKKYLLILDMHHIITDGVSMTVFIREFMTLYSGGELSRLSLRYRDYAAWMNSDTQQEMLSHHKSWWLEHFSGDLPVMDLPTDYARPVDRNRMVKGAEIMFTIHEQHTKQLNALALEHGVTLFMALLAVFNVTMARLTGLDDIIVGTVTSGRRHADLENIIGMFVNTLALRNFPSHDKPFDDFLSEVGYRSLQAFEHQDYPFQQLVENLNSNITRTAGRNPLFDVYLQLQNLDAPPMDDQLILEPYAYDFDTVKFDLSFTVKESASSELDFSVIYNRNLFNRDTIEMIIALFNDCLTLILEDPSRPIGEIVPVILETGGNITNQMKFNDDLEDEE